MMGSTHATAGFVLWFGLSRLNVSPPLGIVAVLLGSLLPDIDHPNSTIRQMLELPQFLLHPVQEILPHRGPTHTIWAGFVFAALTFGLMEWGGYTILIGLATGLAMLAGYVSHLVLDSLNPTGVHWLRPWKETKISWIIRTSSRGEEYFFYGLIGSIFLVALL